MKIFRRLSYLTITTALVFGYGAWNVIAHAQSVLYVPLIGISSVPDPLALPSGPGSVTYNYAVKNFLQEAPLTNVQVSDDNCSPAKFVGGDDNGDGKLDFSETWRYSCTTKLSVTTQSIATAIGTANNLPAAHKAYTTVVVGSSTPAPLVNIINVTKVAYPLTLPIGGGDITFTYRVNNPGVVPLSDVTVSDNKCPDMSGKLGDTNGNNLLDITEVWIYTCKTHLTETTTNTVSVAATANGLKAVGYATITITVAIPTVTGFPSSLENTLGTNPVPSLPNTGTNPDMKIISWVVLLVILTALVVFYAVKPKRKSRKK